MAVGDEGMPDSRLPLWWAQQPRGSRWDLQTAWHSAARPGCGEAWVQMQTAMTANLSWQSPGVLDMCPWTQPWK